jgi:hypothetical protein
LDAKYVHLEQRACLFRRERFRDARRADASVVDEDVETSRLRR